MPRKIKIKYLEDIEKPWNIDYAALKTKFGDIQLGTLNGVVCFLYFVPPSQLVPNLAVLIKRWPEAKFSENYVAMKALLDLIISDEDKTEIQVLLAGTEFQNKVWKTLLDIPKGNQWTYSECAERIRKPTAVRAVANAIGKNEVSYLIPCHRVVSKGCNKFKYRWGAERKKELLNYECKIKE